jgi:hypothetical protein
MLIVIIVKKGLKDCFGNIRSSVAGAGILGVMVLLFQIHPTDNFESQFTISRETKVERLFVSRSLLLATILQGHQRPHWVRLL